MAVPPVMAHAQSGASRVVVEMAPAPKRGEVPDPRHELQFDSGTSDAPNRITGFATWYDAPSPQDAAAGPSLRKALGKHWRGSTVRVCADECVTVRLTDWCACGSRHGVPTVLDLDDVAFSRIAKLSAGVVRVRVTVVGQIDVPLTRPAPTARPIPTAPQTDLEVK